MRIGGGFVALGLVVAVSCGTASVTPSASPVPTAIPTAAPSATPPSAVTHDVVYFARDRLPPVGAHIAGAGVGATTQLRIGSRLDALFAATPPAGLFNVVATAKARPAKIAVESGYAFIDFGVPDDDWGVAGSAGTRAFIQQIVYTVTEEPGIGRVLITQNGGRTAIVGDGLIVDHAVGRIDVAGYTFRPSLDPVRSFEGQAPAVTEAATIESRYSVDALAPGLVRLVVELARPGAEGRWLPAFETTIAHGPTDLGTPYEMRLEVFDGRDRASDAVVDRTPLRRLKVEAGSREHATVYRLGLDDLRPWRVGVLFDPVRVVLDIGGDPDAVNANVAIYHPRFGEAVGRTLAVSGMTRVFEATFEYRLTDLDARTLVGGHGTASYGTSAIWGAFEIAIPAVTPDAAYVEVFLRSPRDGRITDRIAVPIAAAR